MSHKHRLRLLASPARPTRVAYVPPSRPPRRPGERREPLSVTVSPAIVAAAGERGLHVGCAVELCLERALVVADLEALGGDELYERVLTNAATATITAPLPSAKARYLQMLLATRDHPVPRETDAAANELVAPDILDVPLRLFPRVASAVDQLATGNERVLAEALALEIAAISDGRTMSEWTALTALRLTL